MNQLKAMEGAMERLMKEKEIWEHEKSEGIPAHIQMIETKFQSDLNKLKIDMERDFSEKMDEEQKGYLNHVGHLKTVIADYQEQIRKLSLDNERMLNETKRMTVDPAQFAKTTPNFALMQNPPVAINPLLSQHSFFPQEKPPSTILSNTMPSFGIPNYQNYLKKNEELNEQVLRRCKEILKEI